MFFFFFSYYFLTFIDLVLLGVCVCVYSHYVLFFVLGINGHSFSNFLPHLSAYGLHMDGHDLLFSIQLLQLRFSLTRGAVTQETAVVHAVPRVGSRCKAFVKLCSSVSLNSNFV